MSPVVTDREDTQRKRARRAPIDGDADAERGKESCENSSNTDSEGDSDVVPEGENSSGEEDKSAEGGRFRWKAKMVSYFASVSQ